MSPKAGDIVFAIGCIGAALAGLMAAWIFVSDSLGFAPGDPLYTSIPLKRVLDFAVLSVGSYLAGKAARHFLVRR